MLIQNLNGSGLLLLSLGLDQTVSFLFLLFIEKIQNLLGRDFSLLGLFNCDVTLIIVNNLNLRSLESISGTDLVENFSFELI